jgi:hypothetical protein
MTWPRTGEIAFLRQGEQIVHDVDEMVLGEDRSTHRALPNGFDPWQQPELHREPLPRQTPRSKLLLAEVRRRWWAERKSRPPDEHVCQQPGCGATFTSYGATPSRIRYCPEHNRHVNGPNTARYKRLGT